MSRGEIEETDARVLALAGEILGDKEGRLLVGDSEVDSRRTA